MSENPITYFAETDFRNRRTPFGIKASDRTRHVYVIGKTGMGKSTMLENMAIQDIQNGNGLAFVDPHGKTAEMLLDYVPENRINDVLYFAPFDMDYPVSFNIMEDVGPDKRHLVVNGLMSTFEKIWVDAWSARMAYILSNSLLALLEYPGSTLLGINRLLSDKEYRKVVVSNIKDPSVRSFWMDEFSKYTDRYAQEATPAIQNKVGQFTSNPLIRNIVGQTKSTFDFRKMMDERKIIIVNLSKGRVGEGNANLLGSMIITKLYLAAMSRADVPESRLKDLPNFYLYVDEFQSFANKSFADILSEARKYKLNLTIAHQYIEQMEEEVRAAVFGNVGTFVTFRVGAFDAEVLEKEFAPQFTAEDLVNLGSFQVYLKLMIDGVSSAPFSAVTMPPIERPIMISKSEIVDASRKQFARTREEVEREIVAWHEPVIAPKEEKKKNESPVRMKEEKKDRTRIDREETERKNEFARAFMEAGVKITPPTELKTPAPSGSGLKIESRPELVTSSRNSLSREKTAPTANSGSNQKVSAEVLKNILGEKEPTKFSPPNSGQKSVQFQNGGNGEKTSSFSLVNLKSRGKGDDPKIREQNMSALKSALSDVLKKNSAGVTKEPPKKEAENLKMSPEATGRAKGESNFSGKLPPFSGEKETRQGGEVSPEVLKKILSDEGLPKH